MDEDYIRFNVQNRTHLHEEGEIRTFINEKFKGNAEEAKNYYRKVFKDLLEGKEISETLEGLDEWIQTNLALYVEHIKEEFHERREELKKELEMLENGIQMNNQELQELEEKYPYLKELTSETLAVHINPSQEEKDCLRYFEVKRDLKGMLNEQNYIESRSENMAIEEFYTEPILFETREEYKERVCRNDGYQGTHRLMKEELDKENSFND